MIRFDWNVLQNYKQDVELILKVLHLLSIKELSKKEYPRRVLKIIKDFQGSPNFLLNPEDLILNRKMYSDSEIYLYLEIAAHRSYFNYHTIGSIRLPTHYIEFKYDIDKLSMNRLLSVTNEEIIFKYEETKING